MRTGPFEVDKAEQREKRWHGEDGKKDATKLKS